MRLRTMAILLLPALLYRALIPVGFMPMVGAGGALEIDFCPGTRDAVSLILTAQPHSGHHHGHDGAGGVPLHNEHRTPCQYALSATPALAQVLLTWLMPVPAVADAPPIEHSVVFLPAILRTQSPRGPPALI